VLRHAVELWPPASSPDPADRCNGSPTRSASRPRSSRSRGYCNAHPFCCRSRHLDGRTPRREPRGCADRVHSGPSRTTRRGDLMAVETANAGGSVMNDLLETVIEAHGGLERWNQLSSVSARLIQGGALWALKVRQEFSTTSSSRRACTRSGCRTVHSVRPTDAVRSRPSASRSRTATERSSKPLTSRAPRLPGTRSRPRGAPFSLRTSWARRCGPT
jgi:hypothetical protein